MLTSAPQANLICTGTIRNQQQEHTLCATIAGGDYPVLQIVVEALSSAETGADGTFGAH